MKGRDLIKVVALAAPIVHRNLKALSIKKLQYWTRSTKIWKQMRKS